MKDNVVVVIGSGYGDEGKGALVDYYATNMPSNTINIRFNSGAQAGHTVVKDSGERHIFSHFGAGTLVGLTTMLAEEFVVNPKLFFKELKELEKIITNIPLPFVHQDCLITTPYDVLVNQKLENSRGVGRHGSVGVGFGETILRNRTKTLLTVKMAYDCFECGTKYPESLVSILDEIVIDTTTTLKNIGQLDEEAKSILEDEAFKRDVIDDIKDFVSGISIFQEYQPILEDRPLLFEGAQGLLLDMDYGEFPHVTRSNTGMKNVRNILRLIPERADIEVNYVTRAYVTRHGAGPMATEISKEELKYKIIDNTNIDNNWQGSLRFGRYDHEGYMDITSKDFDLYAPKHAKRVGTITCLDQVLSSYDHEWQEKQLLTFVLSIFKYASYGPTSHDIKNNDR